MTASAATDGAMATRDRRGLRTATAMAPRTSHTIGGGYSREAWFNRCASQSLASRLGMRAAIRLASSSNFSYRRSSRGSSKTKEWSVGERQTSRALPNSVCSLGPKCEAGTG